jgi:hypothetical protein
MVKDCTSVLAEQSKEISAAGVGGGAIVGTGVGGVAGGPRKQFSKVLLVDRDAWLNSA